jgi:hypothetical protein
MAPMSKSRRKLRVEVNVGAVMVQVSAANFVGSGTSVDSQVELHVENQEPAETYTHEKRG